MGCLPIYGMTMSIVDFRGVVEDQERERTAFFASERVVEREVGREHALNSLKYPNALAVLGVRRCGKSVYSWLLLRDTKHGYLNFDDERLYGVRADELNVALRALYERFGTDLEYIILDEIQNIAGWELFVNRLRRTKKVVVTGSNSKLLSGELADRLTGRHVDITLFPFSYSEFLTQKGVRLEEFRADQYATDTVTTAQKMVEEYLHNGGFPEVGKFGREILRTIFKDIVTKDVVRRHNIRNVSALEALARYMTSNFSREISYNKLRNVFELKKLVTIRNYTRYLQDAYLLLMLERFSFGMKQSFIAPKKVYCIDTGIVNMVSQRASEDRGALMENAVAIELARRKSYRFDDTELYYWKDHQQREVDFVVKSGQRVTQLIQVCYDPTDLRTKEREVKSVLKASQALDCKSLLVITLDHEEELQQNGLAIAFKPLWKWLLGL